MIGRNRTSTTISGNAFAIILVSVNRGGNGMKIKISYTVDETENADALEADIRKRLPNASVKRSDRHPPYRHIYISYCSENTCFFKENMVK